MSTADAPERATPAIAGPAPRILLIQAPYYSGVVGGMLRGAERVLAEARATAADAAGNAARARTLAQTGALSQQQINQYQTAEQTARARVTAAEAVLAAQQVRGRNTQVLAPDDDLQAALSNFLFRWQTQLRDARVAFDPSVAAAEEQARNEGGTGLTWQECGPVAAHSGKEYYAHDGSVSLSMMMVEPPRGS